MYTLIAGAIIGICSSLIGLSISRRYKQKADYYSKLCYFIEQLTQNIMYNRIPLPQFIAENVSGDKNYFAKVMSEYLKIIKSGGAVTRTALENCVEGTLLSAAEKSYLLDMLTELGKLDKITQLSANDKFFRVFSDYGKTAKDKYRTMGVLASKLGVLLGIAIMLILA